MRLVINIFIAIIKNILMATVFAAACICYALAVCFIVLTFACIPYANWPQFLILPAFGLLFFIAGNSCAETVDMINYSSWRI